MEQPLTREQIGASIRRCREESALSHQALSDCLRARGVIITPSRLKRMEAGLSTIYARDLTALSEVLHTTCDRLVGRFEPR